MSASFVCLYRGETIAAARLVAASSDARLVAHVATELLHDPHLCDEPNDPVLTAINSGKRRGLRLVQKEIGE